MTMNPPRDWADHLSSLDNAYIFASEGKQGALVTFASETRCRDCPRVSCRCAAHSQPMVQLNIYEEHWRSKMDQNSMQRWSANFLTMYRLMLENGMVVRIMIITFLLLCCF